MVPLPAFLKVDPVPPAWHIGSMPFAIPFPDISPDLFSITVAGITFALRWYALAYIAGILIGLWIGKRTLARPGLWGPAGPPMTQVQAEGLITWIILGILLGGRLGFVLFYQPGYYLQNPGQILALWQGGMAFHGGLLGVAIAGAAFCWREGIPPLGAADAMALATPPGLLLGRLANFVNGELWGRPTELPWGVSFPGPAAQACGPGWPDPCARHPSQLYEAGLEGLALGALLLWLAYARGALKRPGRIAGIFFTGYGAARIFVEYFRQADAQFVTPLNPWGHVLRLGEAGLTMGQLLSLPMLLLGLALLALSARRPRPA